MNAEAVVPPPLEKLPPDEQPTIEMEQVNLPDQAAPNTSSTPITPESVEVPPHALPDAPDDDDQTDGDADAPSFTVQLVDESSGVQANSGDYASAKLARETSQKGFKGFLKKIWHGNLAREYKLLRYKQEGQQKILEDDNLLTLSKGSQEQHARATTAVVTRFTNELLHDGESRAELESTEFGQKVQNRLKELIVKYTSEELSDEALLEEKTRLVEEYKQHLHAEDRRKGLMIADNVIEVARNAKAAVEHGLGIDRLDAAIKGYAGEARMGQRTELRRDAVERTVDRLYSTKAGSIVNETTLGASLAVGLAIAKITTRKALTAALSVAGLGVGAGLFAGTREYARMGQERTQQLRERAVGMEVQTGSKRREQLEETRYNTVSATDLHDQLQDAREKVLAAEPLGIKNAIETIMAIDARIQLSDKENRDLIDYSSLADLEEERLQLDLALADAKKAAKHLLESAPDELMNTMGISRDFDAVLKNGIEQFQQVFGEDISAKDRTFAKVRLNQAMKMAAVGLVSGVTFGVASQEIRALVSDSLQGVFDGNSSNVDRRTLLAGVFGHGSLEHLRNALHNHDPRLAQNSSVVLPDGYHLQATSAGHWELLNGEHQALAHNLAIDKQGAFTTASQAELAQAGLQLHATAHDFVSHHIVHESVQRTPEEFLHRHPGDFTHVSRQLWYDNNTPNVYDQNELRLDWGHDGVGIDQHGNFVFNVSEMTPGGSFHDGFSANAQQLIHEGKMAIALSMTEGTQSHVVLVHIDVHGNAIIPAHSWMAHSLFANENGQAHFTGAYAEAVQLMGKHHGVESMRMLATVVGENHVQHITDHVSHLVTQHHEGTITTLNPIEHHTPPVEIPPVIPIYARRGLGIPHQTPEGYYGYYNNGYGREYWEDWEVRRSPRLRRNPNATLEPGEELEWYAKSQEKLRGEEYVEEIEQNVEADQVLKNIGDETKAVVCIPVAAANEADNIYRTLQLFAAQDADAKAASVILLNVNWKRDLESKPEEAAKIQKTLREIERAKTDFPELRIATMQKVWEPDFVRQKQGKIYGEVIKVLYDTAALAVEVSIQRGRRAPTNEALLITNDADTLGMSRHYLRNYIKALNDNPEIDAFSGTIRRGTESYKEFPGYGAISNFYALLNMVNQQKLLESGAGGFTTEGPNSAVKMSIYAAMGGVEERIGAGADAVLGQRLGAVRRTPSTKGVWRRRLLGKKRIEEEEARPRRVSYVHGVTIDTLPDRLLGAYRQGRWIATGWSGFDNGGYEGREVSMGAGTLDAEDPEQDMDSIARRLEVNVEAFATEWYRDPSVVATTLHLWFGQDNDDDLYTSSWDWSNSDKPQFHFHITNAGKEVLKRRMLAYQRGKIRPFSALRRA